MLSQVRHIADERGLRAMAITFGTSPRSVLGRGDCSKLTTADERTTLLRQVGMDEVAVLDFTPQMAAMTAYDFMLQVLKEQLHVAVLVIGYDHRFGRGRSEGFDDYVRYGREIGIEVVRGEACIEGGEPVSSTRIRQLLEEGQVDEAAQLLGYRYTLHGKVVGGYREGRKMGFPTANIALDEGQQTTDKVVDCKLIPSDGVYAVYVNVVDNEDENVNDNENFHQEGATEQFGGQQVIHYRFGSRRRFLVLLYLLLYSVKEVLGNDGWDAVGDHDVTIAVLANVAAVLENLRHAVDCMGIAPAVQHIVFI